MSAGTKRSSNDALLNFPLLEDLQKSSKSYSTRLSNAQFQNVVQNFGKDQINLIQKVGFGGILNLNCSFTPKALVSWIVTHFDLESKAITFSNGYSFKLSPLAVHIVLGLPYGGKRIDCRSTPEAAAIIKKDTNCSGDSPTINELISLLSGDISGDSFVRTFLLFALCTFLCPTTHGHASPKYFSPLAEVDEIHTYDWCQLIFEWLVGYIKRYQQKSSIGKSSALGGCTFFLAICYIEFMNSSQIVLGASTPRLHLWNSDSVSCLTNLDSQCSFPPSFGRLPVKHISLTLFAAMTGSYCEVKSRLSDTHRSNSQFHVSKLKDSTKRRLCDFSDSLHVAVSEAVKPIIYSYASQYVKIIHEDNLSNGNEIVPDANESHVEPGTISESDADNEIETTVPM